MSLFVLSHSISVVFVGSANKRWEPRGHRWFFGGWHPYNAQIIHQNQMPLLPEKVGNCEMLCTSLPTKIPCGLWHREKVPKWIRTPIPFILSWAHSNPTKRGPTCSQCQMWYLPWAYGLQASSGWLIPNQQQQRQQQQSGIQFRANATSLSMNETHSKLKWKYKTFHLFQFAFIVTFVS